MTYLSNSFGLTLVTTQGTGLVSGFAVAFLVALVLGAWLHGLLASSLYRVLALANIDKWLKRKAQKDLAGRITASSLQALLDLILVGCAALLFCMAALSNSPTAGCTIFFVGLFYSLAFIVLFSLFGNGFQLVSSSAYVYAVACVISFSVFTLVELLAEGSSEAFSYRVTGVLWMSVSFWPLFCQPSSSFGSQMTESAEFIDIGVFPNAPQLCSWGDESSTIRRLRELMKDLWFLWFVSIVPVFIFALYSAAKTSADSSAGVYVMSTVTFVEAIFQLAGNTIDKHLVLVVFNRFLLVLVGQDYWLVGTVCATLCTSWLILTAWVDDAMPSVSFFCVGELIHKAMDELATVEATEITVAPMSMYPNVKGSLRKYPAISLFLLQVYVAVAIGIAASSPERLTLNSLDNMNQLTWTCCFWLIWVATAIVFLVRRVIMRNGLSADVSKSIAIFLEPQNGSTESPTCGLVVSILEFIAEGVKEGMDDKPIVGALCLFAWSATVGASALYANLSGLWLVIPLSAFLPPAIGVFFKFLEEWEKNECPIEGDWRQMFCYSFVNGRRIGLLESSRGVRLVLKSWQLSAVLFVLAIGLACIPRETYMVAVYLGLWLLSAATNKLCVVLWRTTLIVDIHLVALLCSSWVPSVVWSIVFGLRNTQNSGIMEISYFIVMLLFSATAVQLLALSAVIWNDCFVNNLGAPERLGPTYVHNRSGERGILLSIPPRTFLKILLGASFFLLLILFSIFSATISTPLGVALIMLLFSGGLMIALKVESISLNNKILRCMMDKLFLRCTYANTHRKAVAATTVTCLVLSGIFGSLAHPDHDFWWASFSWLALALIALIFGLYEQFFSTPKVHGVYFFPVYSFDAANRMIRDVSLQSSYLLLFLIMMSLYSVWCSIIIEPFESGLVMFLVCNVAIALYVRIACNSAVSSNVDLDLLVNAKLEATERIFSASFETLFPSRDEKLGDIQSILDAKILGRKEAEKTLNNLIASHSTPLNELSPFPFAHFLYVNFVVCETKEPKILQTNPCEIHSHTTEVVSDVEAQPTQLSELHVDKLESVLEQILTAHNELRGCVTDLNKWRAYYLLKVKLSLEEEVEHKTSELFQFLRSSAVSSTMRFTDEEKLDLRAFSDEGVLKLFPPKALATLLDDFRQFRRDQTEMQRKFDRIEAEKLQNERKAREKAERLEREEAERRAKAENERKAREKAERLEREEAERRAKAERRLRERHEEDAASNAFYEVVGRFGVSMGGLSEVLRSLELTKSQPFTDRDFDISGQMDDILGGPFTPYICRLTTVRLSEQYGSQICSVPGNYQHGVVTKLDATQINQGNLGDCYFLSALAALVAKPTRVRKLFPLLEDGPVDKETREICVACSLFAVRLFFDGAFRTVLLDDKILAHSDSKKPFFASGLAGKEYESIWVMLVEKAFAKLHGTFASIVGGFEHLAMEDLTGGFPSIIENLQTDSTSKWENIRLLYEGGHLLGAGTSCEKNDSHISSEGIVFGHAYTILQVCAVDNYKLLRLKNPWGGDGLFASSYLGEWSGAWSDKSETWTPRYKNMPILNYSDRNDGCFWISWSDFARVFRQVYVCKVFPVEGEGAVESGNVAVSDDEVRFQMRIIPRAGHDKDKVFCEWKKSEGSCGTAGGSRGYGGGRTFGCNPQFVLCSSENCTVTIVLTQSEGVSKNRNSIHNVKSARNGICMSRIGLYVFDCNGSRVTGNGSGLTLLAETGHKSFGRTCTLEFRIRANQPLTVVAATYLSNEENTFVLRAFAQMPPVFGLSEELLVDLLPIDDYQQQF